MGVFALPPRGLSAARDVSTVPAPLLPRVAAGDESAVRECFHRYSRLVYALARRFSRIDRDVDDACQDIFVALWKSAAAFDPARASEATFVAMIARRRLIDRARVAGTRQLPEVAAEPPVPSSALDSYVDGRNAVAALVHCTEEQRRVIMLAVFSGLTHEEIAQELKMALGTVKSHYARGLDRLKRALQTGQEGSR